MVWRWQRVPDERGLLFSIRDDGLTIYVRLSSA